MRTAIFIALVLLLTASCGKNQSDSLDAPISKSAVVTLHIEGYPDFMAADAGGIWVTNEGRVEKLVIGERKPVITSPMPQPCGAMVVDFGSVWVPSCSTQSVYRINRKSGLVEAVIATGLADSEGELSLASGANSIWVLSNDNGTLSRIDPDSNQVSHTIAVAPHSYTLAFAYGSVWVVNHDVGTVQRIDPEKEEVVSTIKVDANPRFLAAGIGAIWTLNQLHGTVSKINPTTEEVTTINVGVPGTGGDIGVGDRFVYVRAKQTLLSVIDPATDKVIARYGPAAGSGAVRVENGRVWVTAHDINTIWILDEKKIGAR
jgi:virginiamycin B lyase